MSKERLLQLQFALFFKSIENRPDKLISKVDAAMGDLFDQMPNMMPLPQEAPPEIPRVTMQSSDGIYICNISKNRIDFIGHYITSGSSVATNLEDFIEKIYSFSEAIFKDRSIIRFGFIEQYFLEHSNAVDKIKSKYLKLELGNLEELSFRYNQVFVSDRLEMNDIVEISKGSIFISGVTQKEGIIIQRDFNNKPLEVITIEDMKSVIDSNKNKFKTSGIRELIE